MSESSIESVSLSIERAPTLGAIALIRLARPPVNAIDDAMKLSLLDVCSKLSRREDVMATVIHGDKVFAAGGDIKEMAQHDRTYAVRGREHISGACTALAALPMPVIAAVTGFALGGGCELALAADFRITATNATWGLPGIRLGLMPAAGGTQRLARLIGTARAKRLLYTGRTVTGTEAVSLGLADAAVPAAEVLATAREWAEELAQQAPTAVRAIKQAVDYGIESDLASGLRLESALFAGVFGTDDATEGLAYFVANGPGQARFTGR